MRFGARLTLFLVVVLISVQTLTVGAGHVVSREQLVERGKAQLERDAQVFERKLDLVLQRIADSVTVLALDYPLREAIAQQNLATAASALNNDGGRIGARRMFLVDLDGTLLLGTVAGTEHPTRFAFPEMLDEVAAKLPSPITTPQPAATAPRCWLAMWAACSKSWRPCVKSSTCPTPLVMARRNGCEPLPTIRIWPGAKP